MTTESGSGPCRFESVLGCGPHTEGPGVATEPDYFGDLNLDQVFGVMTSGREEYDLAPFFYAPLHEPAAVRYRHGVLRDLEQPDVLEAVGRFAEDMRTMRAHLEQAEKLYYELQRQSLFVDRRRGLL